MFDVLKNIKILIILDWYFQNDRSNRSNINLMTRDFIYCFIYLFFFSVEPVDIYSMYISINT